MWEYNRDGDEIYHHGKDGQRWGIRNGPPYPLDRSAARQAAKKRKAQLKNLKKARKIKQKNEKKRLKEQKKEKMSFKDVYYTRKAKNKFGDEDIKHLSNEQLKSVVERMELEQRYNKLSNDEIQRGRDYAKYKQEKLGRTLGNLTKAIEFGTKVYNFAVTYSNNQDKKNKKTAPIDKGES